MSEKGIGSKFLGLFVESDPDHPAPEETGSDEGKSPADIVAELAQKSGGAAGVTNSARPAAASAGPALKLTASETEDGKPVDFDAIFRGAGMDPAELDWVKKAQDLLKSLPEATPLPIKRQIVEASLKAFGFDVQKIPVAAENQKRAVDAYLRVNENATARSVSEANTQIQSLNDQIAKLRTDIERRNAALSSLATQAQARKGEVQKVIEFFAAPVAPQG
ncbi:MAG: hypothetical protein M3Y59_03185 [Myxococcota bacterium]|nr:hypothetical protein [Myxococcota bacterium]